MSIVTRQELEEASIDAATLETFANGAADLNGNGSFLSRLGTNLYTIARLIINFQAAFQVAIDSAYTQIVTGGAPIVSSENIALLTTLSGLTNGQIVNLKGYDSNGDGGAQQLIYVSTGRTGITVDDHFYFLAGGADDYFIAANRSMTHVELFGAKGDGVTDDAAAIQRGIDYLHDRNGGTLSFAGGRTYNIESALQLGTRVKIQLNGAIINQVTDNTQIFVVSQGTVPSRWAIVDGYLRYENPQPDTNTNAIGIQIGVASKTSSHGVVDRLTISDCYQGIALPQLTGAYSFFNEIKNTTIKDCSSWGIYIRGDSNGGHTNNILRNVWCSDVAGATNGMMGFYIFGTNAFRIDNCGADNLTTAPIFNIESSRGSIGNIFAEKWDVTKSSGAAYVVLLNAAICNIDYLYTFANEITLSGSASGATIRAISGTVAKISKIREREMTITDTSSDNYYQASTDNGADTRLDNDFYEYSLDGGTAPAGNLGEFNNDSRANSAVWSWNGRKWKEYRYTNLHTFIQPTTAELEDITSWINADGFKYPGFQTIDPDSNTPIFAVSTGAGSAWVDGTGSNVIVPT